MYFDICPNCFSQVDSPKCKKCGHDQSSVAVNNSVLKPMTILHARYLLGRVLGKGGFGVTYLAKDLQNDNIVAIKECMPEQYCTRNVQNASLAPRANRENHFRISKLLFLQEVEALFALRNNSFVVDIYDRFAENNTEYFVMEYIDGISLKALSNSQGGRTSINTATSVLFTVGSALMEVHRLGIIHRDISPENIMLSRDGGIKLIDFGAAKNMQKTTTIANAPVFLKPGFAPPEQYNSSTPQGEWTDVYALAATYYTTVSGRSLVSSVDRIEGDNLRSLSELECGISQSVSDVVSRAMMLDYRDRYAEISDFLDGMSVILGNQFVMDSDTLGVIEKERAYEDMHGYSESLSANIRFPFIEILNGKNAGARYRIPDSGFVPIGRRKNAGGVVLDDSSKINRLHCLIGFDRSNERFIVIDKSYYGTYFWNGMRMIRDVDSFVFPNNTFVVSDEGIRIKVFLA